VVVLPPFVWKRLVAGTTDDTGCVFVFVVVLNDDDDDVMLHDLTAAAVVFVALRDDSERIL